MLLATRCPFCETVFRIQPGQLAARRGLVRCGHCQEAFDATGSLFELPDTGEFARAVPVQADLAARLTAGVVPGASPAPKTAADSTAAAPAVTKAAEHISRNDTTTAPNTTGAAELAHAPDRAAEAATKTVDLSADSDAVVSRDTQPAATPTKAPDLPAHSDAALSRDTQSVEAATKAADLAAHSDAALARDTPSAEAATKPTDLPAHSDAALSRDTQSAATPTKPADPATDTDTPLADGAPSAATHAQPQETASEFTGTPSSTQPEPATDTPRSSSIDTTSRDPQQGAASVDFGGRAWDPWAPSPESPLDPSLRFSAERLPPRTLAPGVTPRMVREPLASDTDASAAVVERTAAEATVVEPFIAEPASADRTVAEPTVAEPTVAEPTVAEPHIAEPHVAEPTATEPPASEPTFSEPLVDPIQPAEPTLARETPETTSARADAPTPSRPAWTRVEPDPAEPTFAANAAPAIEDDEPHFTPPPSQASSATPAQAQAQAKAPAQAANEPFSALPPDEAAAPFAMTREAPAEERGRAGLRAFGWFVALLLVVLLAVQLAWWLRETVMVYWPDSQPLYQQACQRIGCRVLPPHDIDGLQVEPSDLRQVDDPHHLELKVPLRNRFNVALAWPAIELTLLDRQNNVVVRRVLWPQDYVAPGTRMEAGLPPQTTQMMIVRLDTGNVVASNFRIEIFYP